MPANQRTAFLESYKEQDLFIPFLTQWFITTMRDIINAESFKIEVKRGGRKIAPVISHWTGKGAKIKKDKYTGKEFTPPVSALGSDFSPGDLTEKVFGKTEYSSAEMSYMAQLMGIIQDAMAEIESQFGRLFEYMASEIFQSGTLTLYDELGNAAYIIDFFPKATHFPTVSTAWSDPNSDPDSDIQNLIKEIKKNGKVQIRNLVFGETALKNYLRNTKVADRFDIRRYETGQYQPREQNEDVTLLGDWVCGTTRITAWSYEGLYEYYHDDTIREYVNADNVLFLPEIQGRNVDFRKVYCKAPTITGVDERYVEMIPATMNLDDREYTTRLWVDGSADTVNVEFKTRPSLIPVSIDAFGCLTTE